MSLKVNTDRNGNHVLPLMYHLPVQRRWEIESQPDNISFRFLSKVYLQMFYQIKQQADLFVMKSFAPMLSAFIAEVIVETCFHAGVPMT